jgi:predicted peptidase
MNTHHRRSNLRTISPLCYWVFWGIGCGPGEDLGPDTQKNHVADTETSNAYPWEDALESSSDPVSTRLVSHPLGSTDAPQGFYEYTPPGYPGSVEWPLIVALHGGGENGDGSSELIKLQGNGIPKLISKDDWPDTRPYVVLMPQNTGEGRPSAEQIQTFIDWAVANYAVDPRYVYLTAYSMGAYGAWEYLQENLDTQIAAIVPISGSGVSAWEAVGCDLARVGIWAFHGDSDDVVATSGTTVPMAEIAECASPPAKENNATIYPDVSHNAWDRTYDLSEGHDIYDWFLNFSKVEP